MVRVVRAVGASGASWRVDRDGTRGRNGRVDSGVMLTSKELHDDNVSLFCRSISRVARGGVKAAHDCTGVNSKGEKRTEGKGL